MRPVAAAMLGAMLVVAGQASAHHVGNYSPGDNEISANFKQLKFSIQAAKFDVARRLFQDGALRTELRARADRLPPGLEDAVREALRAGDARRAEASLVIVLAGLARDLALAADAYLSNPRDSFETRAATSARFLEAIWRYYNLIDFAVSQRDPKSSTAIRLAFDEAEGYAKDAPPAAAARGATASPVRGAAPAPARMRAPLRRIADTLSEVVQMLTPSTRRNP